jgi:hypothetical protein
MARSKITRNTQLASKPKIREALLKKFQAVEKGFGDQAERSDRQMDSWDLYNCKLGPKQFYSGNSRIFVPLVHNAVEARKTRFVNQLFPQAGRNIDVTGGNEEQPHAIMALLETYVRKSRLRDMVAPPLMVSGDVEGQYTVCVTWSEHTRHSVSRETSPLVIAGVEHPELGDITTIEEDVFDDAHPEVEVVSDADLLILPQTCDTIQQALKAGGSVTLIRRYSKDTLEQMIEAEELDEASCENLLAELTGSGAGQRVNTAKKLADQAGIRAEGKHAVVYRTWTMLEVDGERRLVLAYYGGDDQVMGCKLCPYWCDKPDVITVPVKKMPNVAKGIAPVEPCADMQYLANDMLNEGMDSATYGLLPVVMTDPEKNPRVGSMVMDLMAVWETNPNDTKIVALPDLYKQAFDIVAGAERYINQTLAVTPAMIPQSTGKPKRNQAEINMEQQVDILMTSDAVTTVEHGIFNPLIERFAEYDMQYRDTETTVRSFGELGVKAEMVSVPPIQIGARWQFKWWGVEANRNAQQIQQQIALANVLRPMAADPSIQQSGYRFDWIPLIRTIVQNGFGDRLGSEIFKSVRDEMALSPEFENELLEQGFDLPVSPLDNDPEHLQKHAQGMSIGGEGRQPDGGNVVPMPGMVQPMPMQHDPHGTFRKHMQAHQAQMRVKQMAQMMAMVQQNAGSPGGQPAAGKGVKGPRAGAQPGMPRGGQQPPGAMHRDRMPRAGAITAPRKV